VRLSAMNGAMKASAARMPRPSGVRYVHRPPPEGERIWQIVAVASRLKSE
jgi:hypothetical protein